MSLILKSIFRTSKDKVYFVNIIPLEKGCICELFLLFIVKKSSRKSTNYHKFNLKRLDHVVYNLYLKTNVSNI